MKRHLIMAVMLGVVLSMTAGCLPTQTIIVKFEDLRSDFFAMESALQTGDWAKFDWENMIITISTSELPTNKPVALGAFQLAQAASGQGSAAGGQPEIDLRSIETTDTIIQLMRRRQARFSQIVELKKQELLGEGADGLLRILVDLRPAELCGPEAENLRSVIASKGPGALDQRARQMIGDENADRNTLFREVLRQRQLPPDKLVRIGQTFADVQRSMAAPGMWVQNSDGCWIRATR